MTDRAAWGPWEHDRFEVGYSRTRVNENGEVVEHDFLGLAYLNRLEAYKELCEVLTSELVETDNFLSEVNYSGYGNEWQEGLRAQLVSNQDALARYDRLQEVGHE